MRDLLPETWPLASALILARKEALDPTVREAFAIAGIAHLLAISDFHVGVVALLVSGIVRGAGAGPCRAPAYAAAITWLYIGLIGFPDAAGARIVLPYSRRRGVKRIEALVLPIRIWITSVEPKPSSRRSMWRT
jgi:hypothetical protein